MTEKRLPQVGEIWWDGLKRTIGPLGPHDSREYPLICNGTGLTYTNDGIWCVSSPNWEDNLLHIHTDATGKVINPTFPGDEPMKENEPKVTVKPPKPDPITQALEASRERTKDLEALQELTEKAKANKAEAKELATKIKGLKEKVGMK